MLEIIPFLSTVAIGLFAGSLLTEGAILVPYWRRMPPPEFIRLHASLGPSLFRYFAPLTTIAVVLSIITALLDLAHNRAWVVSAVLCFMTLSIFFLYFQKANTRFKDGDIDEETLPQELARWAAWHWLRTCLMLAAFGFSILGHS